MKPKRKDRQVPEEQKSQSDQLQADHEMFLLAFEKPTQIYRYLRSRNVASPILLYRSLSYMKGRSKRKANTRGTFSVDSILPKIEAKHRKKDPSHSYKTDYMNLAFAGFYDQDNSEVRSAEVEVLLTKVCHKKRKDVSSTVMQVSLGKVIVCANQESGLPQVISVASKNFSQSNGHSVKSYVLLFRVVWSDQPTLPNGICSNGLENTEPEDEPLAKRTRRSTPERRATTDRRATPDRKTTPERRSSPKSTSPDKRPTPEKKSSPEKRTHVVVVDSSGVQSPGGGDKRPPCNNRLTSVSSVLYGAELVVYDKLKRCLLTEGEYELALQDTEVKTPPRKQATWETVLDGKAVGPFEVFNKCPTLKFELNWSSAPLSSGGTEEPVVNTVEPPPTATQMMAQARAAESLSHMFDIVPISPNETDSRRKQEAMSPSKRKRIFYQFLYNNNTRQQTEARDDHHCPWCSLNCLHLFALLKHLRTTHARFNFTYTEHQKGARVDVAINECYDGAYVGNPQDLHSHLGYAFSRSGPVRRTPVTQIIVYRPKKDNFDLSEFMEPEREASNTRQLVQGHNRLYFNAVSCISVRPCEIESDQEEQSDPQWLQQKTVQMIDEFTDVNEGEKEVMKMWNLHAMHYCFIGDCQLPRACSVFVEEYGRQILEQRLVKNFMLHLSNLHDFGLIRQEVVYRTMVQLFHLRNRLESEGRLSYSDEATTDPNIGESIS